MLAPPLCRVLFLVGAALAIGAHAAIAQDKLLPVIGLWPPSGSVGQPWGIEALGLKNDPILAIVTSDQRVRSVPPANKAEWSLVVDPPAEALEFDAWIVTAVGISPARRVAAATLPHRMEVEPNDDAIKAPVVELPCVMTGNIDPGTDRDVTRFVLKRGETCSIRCRSRSLEGELSPVMTLIGPGGRELDHYDGAWLDAWLHLVAPDDGEYQLWLQDRSYRKAPGNFYELTITTGPVLVATAPLVVERGKNHSITLFGYALPGGKPVDSAPAGFVQKQIEFAVPAHGDLDGGGWTPTSALFCDAAKLTIPGAVGSCRLQLVDEPVTLEQPTDNNTRAQAQALNAPCEVAGSFASPADVDWYRITTKKDQLLWIEAVGERAGLPMDIEIAIHDTKGELVETLSDTVLPKENKFPLAIESLDPSGIWKAPAAGDYYLAVRDLFGGTLFGVDRQYRMSIQPRREQVAVVTVQSGATLRPGGNVEIAIAALRRSGHEGPIEIHAIDLPAGVTAAELVIKKSESAGMLKLSAAKDAAAWQGIVRFEAATQLDGRDVKLMVRPATRNDDKTSQARQAAGFALVVRSADKSAAKGK